MEFYVTVDGKDVRWEWKDKVKQFWETWRPTEKQVVLGPHREYIMQPIKPLSLNPYLNPLDILLCLYIFPMRHTPCFWNAEILELLCIDHSHF